MRYVPLFLFLFLFLFTPPGRAADDAKPNTLTPKEIADGWLLLFDGETTFGWKIEGEAKVEKGLLVLGGKQETTATTTTLFDHYEIKFEYWASAEDKSMIAVRRSAENESHYPLLRVPIPKPTEGFFHVVSGTVNAPEANFRFTTRFPYLPDQKPMEGWVNTKTPAWVPGPVTLRVKADSQLALRGLKVRPLGLKSIFNGKDLSGWKENKGEKYKSKFTVTEAGEINVKDGPGDLQSEGQWGDFLLQLDCISHGKHLNSGVFFRCRPDEYQQGYEAQIRNQFAKDADQEYTVEEYDPKTNELKEKQKVKSPAVDFGTGAIYRRMPARRQVAKDGEWFTMTVAANGRHLAVWVNGYPVTDWTDNRPLKDNARNGCRLEKGPISFQGHDPTTNLSFRNIRIVEMGAAEGKKE